MNVAIRSVRMSHSDQCKKYYQEHKEEIKERVKKYRQKHKEHYKEYHRKYEKEHRKELTERSKQYAREVRLEVLKYYGNRCACCGEQEVKFLSVDHINNDGAEHRRKLAHKSQNIYFWLRKNNYPKEGFQILCYNCNMAKGFYGECPHKEGKWK